MYFWPLHKASLQKTVKYKDAKVVYSQIGSGQPILLLHGFLEDRSMWAGFVLELAQKFNVISIDLLGHGETDSFGYVHSMQHHAEAVKTVLDAEAIDKVNIIGHSMGGYIALAFAKLFPEMVSKLVLFHSTAFADSDDRKKDRERVIQLVQRSKSVYIKTVLPSLFADDTRKGLKDEIQGLIDLANGFPKQGIVANIRGMMDREERIDVLRDAAIPKLIIHGELDPIISTNDMKSLADLNPNIQLKIVAGIGHMGHLEAPEICLDHIVEFCQN